MNCRRCTWYQLGVCNASILIKLMCSGISEGVAKTNCETVDLMVSDISERQEKRMTGSEAWSIVAPILARFVSKDDEFIETYTTVYRALKKLDEAGGAE